MSVKFNTNIMLDLELAGDPKRHNPAITQIGAIHFDIKTGAILSKFCVYPSLESCLDLGLAQDEETMIWARTECPAVLKKSLESDTPLKEALEAFTTWIGSCLSNTKAKVSRGRFYSGEVKIWANGSMQDNRWIDTAYTACDLEKPWKFYSNMCIMTTNSMVLELTGRNYCFEAIKSRKNAHDAVADCMHQIGWFMNGLNALKNNRTTAAPLSSSPSIAESPKKRKLNN
ncbi:hypothetical protein NHQ30_003034 [Ciborinia camelliae]|nr:hypothetical protein NHQ30_003034 [Ciborinia camelliae]